MRYSCCSPDFQNTFLIYLLRIYLHAKQPVYADIPYHGIYSSKVWLAECLIIRSYVLPRIDYCLSIWGDAPSDSLSKLFRLQKRAARIVLNVNKDTPSIYMFNKLGWMSVYQRVIYQKYLIMYNIVTNICPKYLSRIICFRSEERICNLRSSDKCTLHCSISL